jgi:hypothetical protein
MSYRKHHTQELASVKTMGFSAMTKALASGFESAQASRETVA